VELRCTEVSRCSCVFFVQDSCPCSLRMSPLANRSYLSLSDSQPFSGCSATVLETFFVFLPHSSCLGAKTVKPHIALFHGSFVCAVAEVCCEGCSQQHLVCCFLAAWSACIQYLGRWIAAQCMRCSVVILGDMLHKEQGEDRCFFCTTSIRIVKASSKTHLA